MLLMQSELDIEIVLWALTDHWGKQADAGVIMIQSVSLSTSLKSMSALCHLPFEMPGNKTGQFFLFLELKF